MIRADRTIIVDAGSVLRPAWEATGDAYETASATIDLAMTYARQFRCVVFAWDSPTNWRRDAVPSYKAHRPPTPEGFREALTYTRSCLARLGFPVLEAEGFEADDVIATCVAQAWIEPVEVHSEDKDLYQLVSERVTARNKRGVFGPEAVERKMGVPPSQVRDLLAIAGDSADNIPGCPGIGAGKAVAILKRFGSLDEAHRVGDAITAIDGIGKSTAEAFALWDPAESVLLVTLREDAPVSMADAERAYTYRASEARRTLRRIMIERATESRSKVALSSKQKSKFAKIKGENGAAEELEEAPTEEAPTEEAPTEEAPTEPDTTKRKPRPAKSRAPAKSPPTGRVSAAQLGKLTDKLAKAEERTAAAQTKADELRAAEDAIRSEIAEACGGK